MKKAFAVMRLDARVYLQSGKIILPILLLGCVLGVLYAVTPVDAVGSAGISSAALFFIAAALGLSYAWSEETMFAQTLSVKLGYGCHMAMQSVFLTLCALGMGVLAVAVPTALGLLIPGFYSRSLTALDVFSALSLNALLALNGAALGALFSPRVFPDRKFACVVCLLAGLVGLAGPLMGLPAWALWLFPPVYAAIAPFSGLEAFPAGSVLAVSLRLLLYAAALIAARLLLLLKKRY